MFKSTRAFSSYSVDDVARAREFYGSVLGLELNQQEEGLGLKLAGGGLVFLYPKPNHSPASFTVLNFSVPSVAEAVKQLGAKGVKFERYDNKDLKTDDRGIHQGPPGPTIAWFKDPAGNILSVLEG